MLESLHHDFEKQADAKQAAAETFAKGQKQQESVYKQENRELRLSSATADSLIQAYVKEKLSPPAEGSSLEEIQQRNKKFANAENDLIGAYKLFPDNNSREKALSSLHPDLKDYAPQLSKIENYSAIYRFFVRRILVNLHKPEGNIDGVRDEEGVIDVNKLQVKVDQAVEAVRFVKNEKQSMGLSTLVRKDMVDIFNDPNSVKKWQPFINSLSSESQGELFNAIIGSSNDFKKTLPETPEALQEWVKATHWVDSAEKSDLAGAVRAFRDRDTLNYWKPAIERICHELLVIQGAEGQGKIKKGESQRLLKEIESFIYSHDRGSQSPLTSEEVIAKWQELLK